MESRRATYALTVLAFMNLFNYLDRWMLASLVESVKPELRLTDAQLGLVASAFIIVYTLTAPLFGPLGDRRSRPPLIAFGMFVQSLAAILTGFARGFWSLFVPRAIVGIGEAAYGVIAPAVLADYYAISRRGRALAMFFMAIPVGSAAGYVLGGLVDDRWGWRATFWCVGIPGLLLSLIALTIKDPPRGQHDDVAGVPAPPSRELLSSLVRNTRYVLTVLGYAAYTFGLGALAFWMPAFLERARGMSRSEATVTFGAIAFATGIVGTFVGGWLGDWLLRYTSRAYLIVSGVATLLATPAVVVALVARDRAVFLPAVVIGELLIFMCTGPINSAIVSYVSPSQRATAMGAAIFVMHVLGDIPSPPLIGFLSDRSSLDEAVLLVPVSILISALIWMYAAWRGERST